MSQWMARQVGLTLNIATRLNFDINKVNCVELLRCVSLYFSLTK